MIQARSIAKLGNNTTKGHIITASATVFDGKDPLVRGGDQAWCDTCGGPFPIHATYTGFIEDGFFVGDGDKVLCNCNDNYVIADSGYIGERHPGRIASRLAPDTSKGPEQHAQSARKNSTAPVEKREITLTLGVFFDGTGNNAINTENMLKVCSARHFDINDADASAILRKCAQEDMHISGSGAGSYAGYYTNVHWLYTLYKPDLLPEDGFFQAAIYVQGIGTEAGNSDSKDGQALGVGDTGVIAKTNDAVSRLTQNLVLAISGVKNSLAGYDVVIKAFQFDIFGFSRGAAAARHFANRIQSQDPAIVAAVRQGLVDTEYHGTPAGKTRFIGIFDTVAAIGTPSNGMNPHTADTGNVNIVLRPGVAEKVFHITAQNECRFNFALNSVKPAWPELALPGVHSDIGGGYLPAEREDLFLTRPAGETVPQSQPDEQSRDYQQATAQLQVMDTSPAIAPLLSTNEITAEAWHDDRMQPDHYGMPQKRSFAALSMRNRLVLNDWSRVTLRVMLDAAQEANVIFDALDPNKPELKLPAQLRQLGEKAIAMGKAARHGQSPDAFTEEETYLIAADYIHCSANWNAIATSEQGNIQGGALPASLINFINRPDEQWRRTVYDMDGKKQ